MVKEMAKNYRKFNTKVPIAEKILEGILDCGSSRNPLAVPITHTKAVELYEQPSVIRTFDSKDYRKYKNELDNLGLHPSPELPVDIEQLASIVYRCKRKGINKVVYSIGTATEDIYFPNLENDLKIAKRRILSLASIPAENLDWDSTDILKRMKVSVA